MLSRRSFFSRAVNASTLVALSPTVPGFLARSARAAGPAADGRVLVVIQLDGGNDGINTVVPFRDEGYRAASQGPPPGDQRSDQDRRPSRPAPGHAGCRPAAGRRAGSPIVQGVGYPNPNRSHFESMTIWHTARLGPRRSTRARAGSAGVWTADGRPRPRVRAPSSSGRRRHRRRTRPTVGRIAVDRIDDFLLGDDVTLAAAQARRRRPTTS